MHSFNNEEINGNVLFDAGFSGCVQVVDGQMSGYPSHQEPACPGISNSIIILIPLSLPYSTNSAISSWVYFSCVVKAPSHSLGYVLDSKGNDWESKYVGRV